MNELEKAAEEYVRELFAGNSDGHGLEHTLRVYRLAMKIADAEPCDRQTAGLAALLHDADDHKLFHTQNNANARAFLNRHGVDPAAQDRICEAIQSVSFSQNRGKRPESPEGRIVQDADRLDAIGAVGIARTFAFGGGHGRTPEQSLSHFEEKLLLLKDLMNTETGRSMAMERHAFMELFLKQWQRETEGEDKDTDGRQEDEPVLIRPMNESDARAFTDAELAQGWHADIGKYLARLEDQASGKCVSLTAEYQGVPAGYINVYLQGLSGPFAGKGWPEIVDFGVLEKYRRRGIGTRLMDAAEQAAARVADTVWLGVGLHAGYGSAQRMYVRRGYVPDGSGVWYGDHPCEPYSTCGNDDDLVLFFSKKLR